MSSPYVIQNTTRGSTLATRASLADAFLARARGLLGRRRFPPGDGLILHPCASVHSLFMAFPIAVAFVDREGQVLKLVSSLRPWRMAGRSGAWAAVELPPGVLEASKTVEGDRFAWTPADPPGSCGTRDEPFTLDR